MTVADDITDHDLQVAITLCSLTYIDEEYDDQPQVQKNMIERYLTYADLPMGGRWKLVWGPANLKLNLWYIVHNMDTGNLAVVMRGTLMSSMIAKLGDIMVDPVKPLVHDAPPGVTVAQGISEAHAHLNAATDIWTNRTGWQYLEGVLREWPETGIDIIGHSLGGALAPVVSLDAMQRFPQAKVRSFALAGMSPGNKAFSDWYVSQLKYQTNSRFINPLDIIPKWYAQIDEMRAGFRDNPCPVEDLIGIGLLSDYMAKNHITYHATPNPYYFNGELYNETTWQAQCQAQHEHRYYMLMAGVPLDAIMARFPNTPAWSPPPGAS